LKPSTDWISSRKAARIPRKAVSLLGSAVIVKPAAEETVKLCVTEAAAR